MRAISYADAVREALAEEMRKDKRVLLLGEDIGLGYAGAFGVSKGLYEEFGAAQVIDTPICEGAIVGTAVGAGMLGMKAVAEIMFEDFVTVCFDAIVNQAAKLSFMSGGQYSGNVVVRTPGGSGGGTGPHHSQCFEAFFLHVPGLEIVMPSNPYDAKGLLKTAINRNKPVLFFEHKKLYKTKGEVPEEEYTLPFGQARVVREGKDLTLVALSYMVSVAEEAADTLREMCGLEVEIIDPRTIVPLDLETIGASVEKTNKLVTLEEGVLRGGVGAEIAALVGERCFDHLDYPIKRIGARNMQIPMSPLMEKEMLPDKDRVVQEIRSWLEV
jgi:pyruvate/2-oxoglutarate/acetoin dehydrogenase E1 component